jgi:hypothetical protein
MVQEVQKLTSCDPVVVAKRFIADYPKCCEELLWMALHPSEANTRYERLGSCLDIYRPLMERIEAAQNMRTKEQWPSAKDVIEHGRHSR